MAYAFAEIAAIALRNERNLQALRESEERFRSVTETARAAADHDAICVAIGRSARRRFTRGSRSTVSERLVDRCDRPVLVVPPEPERAAPHEPS